MGEAAETFRSTTNARFSLEIQNGEHMDADQLWTHLAKGMRETAKAVIGETRGTARSTEELNQRLEKWREALEDHGLCVSREKTEYHRCDFDNQEIRQNGDEVISIGGRILRPKESFRYLGSMIHKSGGIDEDVTHRIQAGWMKWGAATGVMCDKRIPLKLKGIL
uniref:uncharacterized protein LOC122595072 n=1 Tax=Erigeron canadensis TaxID=72917 RepID=UPI001CB94822|nr:uncharacterized protein LOC122595072 [Erigeron canadensis]